MFHSEKFIPLDKNLEIKGFYSSYSPQDIQRLRKDIKVLLLKYDKSSYSIIKKDKKKKSKGKLISSYNFFIIIRSFLGSKEFKNPSC